MASHTTQKNQAIPIDLTTDFIDNGWDISDGYAKHSGCNSGLIKNLNIPTEPGVEYTVTYEAKEITRGTVSVVIGGNYGQAVSSNGTFTETLTAKDRSGIMFYSDGDVFVGLLKVSAGNTQAVTIAFKEHDNKWVQYLSYAPEMIVKFINSFFTFKNGQLWEHNVNEVRNNFYGQQYTSKVRFVSNVDPAKEKLWYNIRLDSKGNWSAPELITPASDLFPNGMESRLKKGNFKSIDGKLWADILRDKNDPKFYHIQDHNKRELTALFNGRIMQGGYLVVSLECSDTTEARLSAAEVYYVDLERSF